MISRITPAYAGKSDQWVVLEECFEDHPRLCGEKQNLRDANRAIAGSPPPMRGKAFDWNSFIKGDRITPAYAGKSC